MKFSEAFEKMKSGAKVKLPSWGGYWCWNAEKETIMMHCRLQDADKPGDVFATSQRHSPQNKIWGLCQLP